MRPIRYIWRFGKLSREAAQTCVYLEDSTFASSLTVVVLGTLFTDISRQLRNRYQQIGIFSAGASITELVYILMDSNLFGQHGSERSGRRSNWMSPRGRRLGMRGCVGVLERFDS